VTAPLLSPSDAVNLLARTLTIHPARAQQLLHASGITLAPGLPGTPPRYSRLAVHSLAQLTARHRVPVGGGPHIGFEAELDYRDGQDRDL
jgi:hypothetical protein